MRTLLIVAGLYLVVSLLAVPILARMFGVVEDDGRD